MWQSHPRAHRGHWWLRLGRWLSLGRNGQILGILRRIWELKKSRGVKDNFAFLTCITQCMIKFIPWEFWLWIREVEMPLGPRLKMSSHTDFARHNKDAAFDLNFR